MEDQLFLELKRLNAILIVVIVVAAGIGATFAYVTYFRGSGQSGQINCSNIPPAPSPNSGNATAGDSPTASFIIVDADPGSPYEGMNGSAYHLDVPWPVIKVHQGQKVTITVMNCASSEPHGFAIAHYLDSGVALPTGSSYTLTFTANEKGTFRMYCSIFCSIHPLMQNGALIVS